jgi:hypothetical protein
MAVSNDIIQTSTQWSRLRQDVGVIVWCSFLTACFATMLFFAIFDPIYLKYDDNPPTWLSDRRTGYALGFFFFWLIAIIAAALTAWLVDSRSAATDRLDMK